VAFYFEVVPVAQTIWLACLTAFLPDGMSAWLCRCRLQASANVHPTNPLANRRRFIYAIMLFHCPDVAVGQAKNPSRLRQPWHIYRGTTALVPQECPL